MKIQGNYNVSYTSRNFLKRNKQTSTSANTQKQTRQLPLGGVVFPIKSIQEVERMKQKLIRIFDLIYEDMADDSKKIGLSFVKPELVFKRLPNDLNAYYLPLPNKIIVNERKLRPNTIARYKDNSIYLIDTLQNGKKIPHCDFALPIIKKLPKGSRYLTQEEKLFMLGATLKHELTHSRQEQIMLSTEGALEYLYESLKYSKPTIYKKLTFDDYKKLFKFCSEYKPNRIFAKDEKISFEYQHAKGKDGENLKIEYTPQYVIDSNMHYNSSDLNLYYANILEVEAIIEQIEYYIKYKKYAPDLNIDKEFQDYYLRGVLCACQTLLDE